MILLVIALISTFSVPQGGSFNLTLTDQSYVELDPCMFFENDLKSSGNYSKGEYRIIASYGCEVGKKEILVRFGTSEERILIDIEKEEELNKKLVEIQKELLVLRKNVEELSLRRDYLQSLVAVLNDINVQLYDKQKDLAEKNNMLSLELEKAKSDLENCSKNITAIERRLENMQASLDSAKIELDHCNSELTSLTSSLKNSSFYLELFKNLTILGLGFIVGIFLAIIRRY